MKNPLSVLSALAILAKLPPELADQIYPGRKVRAITREERKRRKKAKKVAKASKRKNRSK